ncbi:hypothetical protein IAT38_006017 [Cryptococcus sp. DSM 104549]
MSNPLDQPVIPTPPSTTPDPQVLAIEAPRPDQEKAEKGQEEEVHVLDVGDGNKVKLDKLGPMIVNSDGTLSRIQNWLDLTPFEQERTVRLLVKKRNLVRLKALSEAEPKTGEEELSATKEAVGGLK